MLGCRPVQFACRRVTGKRCLVDRGTFKIEVVLLPCTLPTPALRRCPRVPHSMDALRSGRKRACEPPPRSSLACPRPRPSPSPGPLPMFATKQAFRGVMWATGPALSHAHISTPTHTVNTGSQTTFGHAHVHTPPPSRARRVAVAGGFGTSEGL